jgi:hypothetical protein
METVLIKEGRMVGAAKVRLETELMAGGEKTACVVLAIGMIPWFKNKMAEAFAFRPLLGWVGPWGPGQYTNCR